MQQNNTTPPTNSNTPATVPGSTTSNAGGASSTNNNNNTSTSSTTSSSNSTSTSTPSSSNNHHHHHNNNNSSNPNSGRGHRYSNQNHVYQNNQSSYGYIPQGLPINAYWSQQAAVAQQAYQNGYSPYPYGYYSQPVYATGPSGHGKYDYVQHGQQQQHHHHNNHSHNNNNNNSSNNNSSSNPPQQQSHNSNTPSITSKSFSPKNNNKVPIVNQKGETANFKNLIRQRAAAAAANSGHEQSVSPSVSASTSHPVPPKPLNVANASEITPATEDAKKTPVQQPVTLSVNAKPSLATPSTTTKPAVAATSPTPVALAPVAVAPVAPVPVALAPVVPAPVDAVAAPSAPASSAALDFKAAILAKLKNKKPALSTTDSAAAPASAPASAHVSAPAPASAPAAAPTSSPAATSPATSTPAASSLPEKPVSSKPVEKKSVDEPEQVSRKEAEPVTAEKSVAEVPPVEKTVEKEAPVAEEPVKQEAPVAEEQVKSEPSTAPVAVKADEPVTLSDSLEKESTETEQDKQEPKATEVEAAEEAQEEETPVDTYTISQFFDKIKAAKPIDNVYEFKYPEGTKLPDTKFTKDARRKYDPLFLLQFKDIVNLPVDENWTEKFGSKIVIPKSTGKDNKSDRSFSKNGGQFGKGVIGGSGAPLLGSAMRNQNVRDFNGSRSGSRSGSKRGPREKSKRDRSDRGDRQQSRRHRGGDSKEAERNPDGTIRPLDKPATVGFNNEPLPPPPTELKPLEKSAGRWVPKFQRKKEKEVKLGPDGTPILDDDDVESKVKSYLNKLTLEKFDTISNDIIQIADQSKFEEDNKSVNKVIQLTFAKACDEPHWSAMYAKFCLKLVTDISPDVFKGEVPEEFSKQNFASKLVRKNLIEICQKEYTEWSTKLESKEINLSLDMNNVELMSDEYYKVAAAKRRGLGLVRFIGELYILKLLGLAVITQCCKNLLNDIENPAEDTLETLSQLVTATGKKIDTTEGKNGATLLDNVFGRIKIIIENCNISSRIKFKLMDLIDLRKCKWENKSLDQGPKTIAEIHEAKRIAEENEAAARSNSKSNGLGSRQNSTKNGWRNNTVSANDLRNVGRIRNNSERSLGPNSFSKRSVNKSSLLSQPSSTKLNSQAGKTEDEFSSVSAKSSSTNISGLAAREMSKRSDSQVSNRFAALQDEEDSDSEVVEPAGEIEADADVEENEESAETEELVEAEEDEEDEEEVAEPQEEEEEAEEEVETEEPVETGEPAEAEEPVALETSKPVEEAN